MTTLKQDVRWPPYRVDNLTSFNIRYRQALSSSDACKVPAASLKGGLELPWDVLEPQAAAPFSWDQPAGASRELAVGFEQVRSLHHGAQGTHFKYYFVRRACDLELYDARRAVVTRSR